MNLWGTYCIYCGYGCWGLCEQGSGGAVMVKAGALAHIRSCVFEKNMASVNFATLFGDLNRYYLITSHLNAALLTWLNSGVCGLSYGCPWMCAMHAGFQGRGAVCGIERGICDAQHTGDARGVRPHHLCDSGEHCLLEQQCELGRCSLRRRCSTAVHASGRCQIWVHHLQFRQQHRRSKVHTQIPAIPVSQHDATCPKNWNMFIDIHVFLMIQVFCSFSQCDLSYAGRRRGNLAGLAVKRCDRPSEDDELREQHSWGTPYCSILSIISPIMSLMMKPKIFEADDMHQNT